MKTDALTYNVVLDIREQSHVCIPDWHIKNKACILRQNFEISSILNFG